MNIKDAVDASEVWLEYKQEEQYQEAAKST